MIKSIIKQILPSRIRAKTKKFYGKLRRTLTYCNKTSLDDLRRILTKDLGIKNGDRLIVTSGFGNLNAEGYGPKDVIMLIQDIIGSEGTLMMPYYPPLNSTEWAKVGKTFDMRHTKSGVGIITEVFKTMADVHISKHPTKAVAVWGKDASDIVAGHENSTTPFYWDSPYGKLLKLGSKSLGLGVWNNPMMHCVEDVLSEMGAYYQKSKYSLQVIDRQGNEMTVKTFVHNPKVMDNCVLPGKYVESLKCQTYKKVHFGYSFCCIVDNQDLFERSKVEFAKGKTRKK